VRGARPDRAPRRGSRDRAPPPPDRCRRARPTDRRRTGSKRRTRERRLLGVRFLRRREPSAKQECSAYRPEDRRPPRALPFLRRASASGARSERTNGRSVSRGTRFSGMRGTSLIDGSLAGERRGSGTDSGRASDCTIFGAEGGPAARSSRTRVDVDRPTRWAEAESRAGSREACVRTFDPRAHGRGGRSSALANRWPSLGGRLVHALRFGHMIGDADVRGRLGSMARRLVERSARGRTNDRRGRGALRRTALDTERRRATRGRSGAALNSRAVDRSGRLAQKGHGARSFSESSDS
jgi:hypothetical protein